MNELSDGLIVVAKRDCPTCTLIEPVYGQLANSGQGCAIFSQDDPSFPATAPAHYDGELETSYRLGIEIVPTLIRMEKGREVARTYGWDRAEWERITGIKGLGEGLPASRPGCGSKSTDPGIRHRLAVRFNNTGLKSRVLDVPDDIDPIEYCAERGWSDGLPLVPPTEEKVLAMLDGTTRAPSEVIGIIPPDRVECTIEKIAINAVMAGCKPEYLPVVIAAVEASLTPEFGLHGIICTTNAVAPVIMVNGPIAQAIGMNGRHNAFGQGNRANAAIGRAFQLVMRNIGGGRPGEIDRAVFGNPGKYTFCFCEDEDPEWTTYAEEKGFGRKTNVVTLFPGDGAQPVRDEIARTPEELCVSFSSVLKAIYHPGQVADLSAFLVVCPEHAHVFHQAGWSKERLKDELIKLMRVPLRDVHGPLQPGRYPTPEERADPNASTPKFRTGSFNIIRAGGSAGKFSAFISGLGSITINPVSKEIRS